MSDQDRFDDRIRRALDDVGASASTVATPPPAADIRRRGDRRRQMVAAGAISTVVVLGGGAVFLPDLLDQSGTSPVVGMSGSPSPSQVPVEPTPTTASSPPTTTVATTPPAAPTPATTRPPTSTEPTGEPATEIPSGFTLPHEGETIDAPQFTDWEVTEGLDTPWPWEVCGVDTYEGDALRTDFRQVAMSGLEASGASVLSVWGDAQDAVGVMAQMRAAIGSCVDDVDEDGWGTSWELRELDIGGESFVAASSHTTADGGPASGGNLAVVVRVGNAIYASYAFADGTATVDGPFALELQEGARNFAPNMCVFTAAGCGG